MPTRYFASSAADRAAIAQALAYAAYRANYASTGTLEAMRQGTAGVAASEQVRQPLPQVQVSEERLAGLPCERLTPPAASAGRVIVYLHGGGFIRGSLALGRANAARIAATAGVTVLAVGYRQAPEHPFPAAPSDVLAAYEAVLASGIAPARVAVVGESSGGCLALGLAVQLQAQPARLPAGIAALSPMTDLALRGASWLYNVDHDVADLATGRRMVDLYLGKASANDPVASPVHHHFRDCCPLLVAIGSHETMLSDAERLVTRAEDAGVPVRFDVYQAMPHGFTRFRAAVADRALDETAQWCRRQLGLPAAP